jgi:hypothetical protein
MALIHCSECNHSISERAATCPNCGAPNMPLGAALMPQQPTRQADAVVLDGTVCPFCAHQLPAGATVCHCGAYYGYKGGILTGEKFKLLVNLLGISLVLLVFGVLVEWRMAAMPGFFGSVVLGVVFLFFVLPIKLQGERWWRQM